MSKKDFNSMIDFQNILDELEKVTYQHEGRPINSNIRQKFESLKEEAIREAEEDLNNIFNQAVMKNVKTLDKVPEPLTEKEAKAFENKRTEAKAKIELNKRKIEYAKKLLEKRIEDKQGYSMDLKDRKMTKKAAKRFFKENKNEITFEDYKIAREFKRAQNKKEVKDFMKDD
tara:strand:+ start:983 stop:1498 length:516 start_codon:yes stop_codon:yes gene_type:complete